ncbi:MAG: autotransporter-associated beta strand repeat-containing protein [Candidatus Latescibacterota bacterium]
MKKQKSVIGLIALTWGLILFGAGSCLAATLYWDGGDPGNSNWSDVDNWNTAADGSGVNPGAAPAAGDNVVFDTGATARLTNTCDLDLTGGITLTVNNPSGAITITVDAPLEFSAGTSLTVGATDALTLTAGFGILALSFDATFDVGAGGLNIASNMDITSGILTVQGAGNTAISGIISGGSGIVKEGIGTLFLSGNNSYTGDTTLNLGNLTTIGAERIPNGSNVLIAAAAAVLTIGGNETITNLSGGGSGGNIALGGNTLIVTQTVDDIFAGVISGIGGGLTKAGGSTLTLSGTNTYTGATTINAGGITTGGADVIADGSSVVIAAGATLTLGGAETISNLSGLGGTIDNGGFLLTVTQSNALTYSGVITGAGGFTKAGAARLTLMGVNGYTGATLISNGQLNVQNAEALGTNAGGVTVAAGASLELQGGITIASESLTLNGGGSSLVNVADANTWNGAVTLAGAGGIFEVAAADLIIGGAIGGAQGFTVSGADATCRFILSGNNSFTGAVNVTGGILNLRHANAAGTDAAGVAINGGKLQLEGGITVATEPLTLTAGGVEELENVANNNAWGGPIALAGNAASDILVAAATVLTLSGNISGGAGDGITQAGAGTLVLSGTNTYPGATTIGAGSVVTIAGGAAIDNAGAVVVDGTINVNTSETIGSLSGAGTGIIVLGANTLTVTQTAIGNFAGVIGGLAASGLTIGAGSNAVLTLSGTNTFTGTTTLAGGAGSGITMGSATTLADASKLVVNSGTFTLGGAFSETIGDLSGAGGAIVLGANTLTVTQANPLTFSGEISGAGGLTKAGAAVLTLSGANTYTGVTTISAGGITTGAANVIANGSSVVVTGALVLGGAETIANLSGTGVIDNGGFLLTVTQSVPQTFSGVISGAGGLTKAGAAVLTLSGTNIYTGVTTISAGGITTGAANVIADGSSVAVTGALVLGGAETIANLSGTGTIDNGGFLLTVTQAADQTFSGVISGAGGLTKAGAAVLTLSGVNLYTGATTVNAGALRLGDAAAFGSGAGGISLGGGILQLGAAINAAAWTPAVTLTAPSTIDVDAAGSTIDANINNGANLLTITGGEDLTFSGVLGAGAGGLTINMDAVTDVITLSGANTYTGPTTITQGTVNFNGVNTGVSALTVNGGKLAGTGTIPGPVTMNTGAILAPGGTNGDAAGTLTFSNGLTFNGESKYVVTVAGGQIDKINVTGALTAAGNAPNIELQAGYNPAGVVVPAPAITVTGAYTAFDPSALPAGYTIDAAKVGNDVRFTALGVIAVPTLSEWGIILTLFLLAGAGITLMRKQRHAGGIAC